MEKYWAMSHGLLHGTPPKPSASKSDEWVHHHGLLNRGDSSPTVKSLCDNHYLDLYDEIAESDSRRESRGLKDERAAFADGGAVDGVSDLATAPNWMQGAPSNDAPKPFKKGGRVHDNSAFDCNSSSSSRDKGWIEWTGHSGRKV